MLLHPLILSLALISSFTVAQQQILSFGTNYHHDQEKGIGKHIGYQWQFAENFALESRYIDHRTLQVTDNTEQQSFKLSRATLGVNFVRLASPNWQIKAGIGLSYTLNSANAVAIDNHRLSPYLSLSAQYQLTNTLAIEMGQSSYFDNKMLNTNHNIFAQLNWQFFSNSSSSKLVSANALDKQTMITPKIHSSAGTKLVKVAKSVTSNWQVQIGAFKVKANAQHRFDTIVANTQLPFSISFESGLYKILSTKFQSKGDAVSFSNMIESTYSINGFVIHNR